MFDYCFLACIFQSAAQSLVHILADKLVPEIYLGWQCSSRRAEIEVSTVLAVLVGVLKDLNHHIVEVKVA